MRTKSLIAIVLLCCMSLAGLARPSAPAVTEVSPTHYDYSGVARQITAGCTDKYSQARAIYRWLCANISYDTTYSIYTADECWDNRRGVCQAYSELFYRLAEPLGLEVYIITGIAKNEDNPAASHAWVFAVVEGEGTGILIDPTWGAGSVNGGVFTRSEDDMSWFHVDPYWMIFTHFPNDSTFQLLPVTVSRRQFDALPIVKPYWGDYGFQAQDIFNRCIDRTVSFPRLYREGRGYVRLAEVPLLPVLRIGQKYTFAVQKTQACELALINDEFYQDWHYADGTYVMEFVPSRPGTLDLSVQKDGEKQYWTVLEYQVPQPTAEDLRRLESYDPLLMPEVTRLDNVDTRLLHSFGFDADRLLAAVREERFTSLPTLYDITPSCTVVDVPFNGTLRVGETYTISIRPRGGYAWAVINEGDWHREWTVNQDTGVISMTVTPLRRGQLRISVQTEKDGKYYACLKYEVR